MRAPVGVSAKAAHATPIKRERLATLFTQRTAVLIPLGLAIWTLLWQLGSSSLFVDETYSWRAASASLGGVFSQVRVHEVAPPAYYLLLHAWLGVFGDATEWSMRLLSVLAGLSLVAAVYWLGRLLGGPAVGLLAALLSAVSPLVVLYAQEVRAYVFAMLAITLAAAAAVQATRSARHHTRWLAGAAGASIAAIWLHYTALLVLVPLCVYIWTSNLPRRARRLYLASCVVATAVIAPLMVIQLRAGHQGGVAPYGRLTLKNVLRVIGTPFDGRAGEPTALLLFGAVLAGGAIAALLRRSRHSKERLLLVGAAALAPLTVLAVTIAAKLFDQPTYDSLITRYSAVAAPFILIALAWWILTARRPLGVVLTAGTLVVALSALIPSYSVRQPNLRAAFERISSGYRTGDGVLAGAPLFADYYIARFRQAHRTLSFQRDPAAPGTTRLWVLTAPESAASEVQALRSRGWRTAERAHFSPGVELLLETH